MRIAIFGTGGVGGYFGGRLAQAGEKVVFIARGEHLQAMLSRGLRVDSIKGDFSIQPVHASSDPYQVGRVDVVLVAVKAWQVPDAALSIQPMMGDDTFVVPLCNGVEAPVQLSEALGSDGVLGGLCRISSFIAESGTIRHVGVEPYVAFGELDGRRSARAERLRQAFQRAEVSVEISSDIQAAMWGKFIFIAAISGLGAVTRSPIGVYRSIKDTRRMLKDAMQEIYHLALAREIELPENIVEQTMGFVDGISPEVTASMQRDIMQGRPSELESQNGAVVRMGRQVGVPTLLNEFIYNSLLPQEMKARAEI